MATSNKEITTTIAAGEDLSGSQYHAIALDDGKVANAGEEATGILINKPVSGAHAEIGYCGELKFAAGAAIAKGAKVTATTSGWFTTADSDDPILGEVKAAVTSGSIGTGLFFFPTATDKPAFIGAITPACGLLAGIAVALDDSKVADTDMEAAAVAHSAVSSGVAGKMTYFGITPVRMDPSQCSSTGNLLTVTTSGYFIACGSGYNASARALANIGSNSTGSALFFGGARFDVL